MFGREVSGFKDIKRDERDEDSGFKASIRLDEERDTFLGQIYFRSVLLGLINDGGCWTNFVISWKPDDEESQCLGAEVV